MIDYTAYRAILCLNGTLPEADFFRNSTLPIIAADGAANHLMAMNITPQKVIGDLDSLKPEYAQQLDTHLHWDQNFSDFEKSLQYLAQHDLLPAIIVGINGGNLDHILNNVNHLMSTQCMMYAPPLMGYVLHGPVVHPLKCPINTKISLLGIPSARVSSEGLQWELDQFAMTFPGKNSCYNRTLNEHITLTVHDGDLLILIEEPSE